MIKNIKHKGLREFAENGSTAGIPNQYARKLRQILNTLHTASNLNDIIEVRALRCHPLKGDRDGEYAVDVTGNLRVVFKVDEPHVLDVTLEDYH